MPIRPRSQPRSARPGFWRHWTLWVWFVLALALSVGGIALWKSGRWLVREDAFEKVRWGVVLAGESRDCERSDAAIRMRLEGKIDTLVISATRVFKNRYQSEFMVDYYVGQGVPRDRLFEFRQDAYSTQEEAVLLIRQFRLQNLDTVLIVTSNFHTARTRRIFRKLAQGYPVVLVASADYPVFDPDAWWSSRESTKLWFDEWMKTFFTFFELARQGPETGKASFQGLTPDVWSGSSGTGNEDPSSPAEADSSGLPEADSAAFPTFSVSDSASRAAADTVGSFRADPESSGQANASDSGSSKGSDDSLKTGVPMGAKVPARESEKKAPRAPKVLAAKEAEPPGKSVRETAKKASAKASSKSTSKKTDKSENRKKKN